MAANIVVADTNPPFVPDKAWHIKIERKLVSACQETLTHLLNFQLPLVGSAIIPEISYVYNSSVSQKELTLAKTKAVFFLFANQSESFLEIFDDENDDISTYRQLRKYPHSWDNTLPSDVAKRILTSYDITQTTDSGSITLSDHKVELLKKHFTAKLDVLEALLCDFVLEKWKGTTPKKETDNLVCFYLDMRMRALQAITQEKLDSELAADTMNALTDARKSCELTEKKNEILRKQNAMYEEELDSEISEHEMETE